jgi:ankyrin repeat protein
MNFFFKASNEGQTDAVSILLENNANVNVADNNCWTPLMKGIKRINNKKINKFFF